MSRVNYLNNAATTWPKPERVYAAVDAAVRAGGTPGRGGSAQPMHAARERIAAFVGIRDPHRLAFLPSATYGLNLAILGLPWEAGDGAIMSGLEHHAVSRPIRKAARERDIAFHVAPYAPGRPIDLDFVEAKLRDGNVRLVACTMGSNVTGELLPAAEIVELAHRYDALCLLDAAQTVGVIPVDAHALGCDMLAFAGHKGLFGPLGVGGLWVREGIELRTLAEGGTGGDSGKHELSGSFPSNYEVGTHNLPAILGLAEGVAFLEETGLATLRAAEVALTARLLAGLAEIPGVRVFGGGPAEQRTSAVSIAVDGADPKAIAARLGEEHETITRGGFHCAPLAHETIGTLPAGGTLRFSAGYFNTADDVDDAVADLRTILSRI